MTTSLPWSSAAPAVRYDTTTLSGSSSPCEHPTTTLSLPAIIASSASWRGWSSPSRRTSALSPACPRTQSGRRCRPNRPARCPCSRVRPAAARALPPGELQQFTQSLVEPHVLKAHPGGTCTGALDHRRSHVNADRLPRGPHHLRGDQQVRARAATKVEDRRALLYPAEGVRVRDPGEALGCRLRD